MDGMSDDLNRCNDSIPAFDIVAALGCFEIAPISIDREKEEAEIEKRNVQPPRGRHREKIGSDSTNERGISSLQTSVVESGEAL